VFAHRRQRSRALVVDRPDRQTINNRFHLFHRIFSAAFTNDTNKLSAGLRRTSYLANFCETVFRHTRAICAIQVVGTSVFFCVLLGGSHFVDTTHSKLLECSANTFMQIASFVNNSTNRSSNSPADTKLSTPRGQQKVRCTFSALAAELHTDK
jgi:hypothetical protein